MDDWLDKLLRTDFLHLAIPSFFIIIFIELTYSYLRHKKWYRLNDTINSLSCAAISQVFHMMTMPMLIGIYASVQWQYGVFDFTQLRGLAKLAAVIGLFIGADFCYYWFHRAGHRINIGWLAHIPHHSSEEYNISTSLRQGMFQHFVSFWFYLPLAVIGFPLLWYVSMASIVSLYQVWLHTRWINKMPAWFEYIFNTPSHHRVHHAMQREYLDKNYAGTLIIWDRLFGSFVAETKPPQYGTTVPLRTWNPLVAQWDYLRVMTKTWQVIPRWQDKLFYLLKGPGWLPPHVKRPIPEVHGWDVQYRKYDPPVSPLTGTMALVLFVVAFCADVMILFENHLTLIEKMTIYFISIVLFLVSGRLLETTNEHSNPIRIQH